LDPLDRGAILLEWVMSLTFTGDANGFTLAGTFYLVAYADGLTVGVMLLGRLADTWVIVVL
jgi:hypothetical protein